MEEALKKALVSTYMWIMSLDSDLVEFSKRPSKLSSSFRELSGITNNAAQSILMAAVNSGFLSHDEFMNRVDFSFGQFDTNKTPKEKLAFAKNGASFARKMSNPTSPLLPKGNDVDYHYMNGLVKMAEGWLNQISL